MPRQTKLHANETCGRQLLLFETHDVKSVLETVLSFAMNVV